MPRRRLDPLLLPATCLLLLTVAGRAAVNSLAPQPARASEVLQSDPARFPHGRLVLLADSAHLPQTADATAAARRIDTGLPLERRVYASTEDPHRRRLSRLVRAYGFQKLPVLLTVDADARVVRIEPL